jgi:hypothetical protein
MDALSNTETKLENLNISPNDRNLTKIFTCTENSLNAIGNIIFMDQSCYIWVSCPDSVPSSMETLVVAMPTKYEPMPITTSLFQSSEDSNSNGIAQRVSKKFNIQALVCCNLPDTHIELLLVIEAKIINILQEYFK